MDRTRGAYTNGVLSGAVGQPWERRPGETEAAYRAFRAYLDMGVGRSVEGAAARLRQASGGPSGGRGRASQPHSRHASGGLKRWAKDHEWAARALAYDNHLAAREVEATARAREKMATSREARRAQINEDSRLLAQQLKLRAIEILRSPLFTTETSGDGKLTTITPANWRRRATSRRRPTISAS